MWRPAAAVVLALALVACGGDGDSDNDAATTTTAATEAAVSSSTTTTTTAPTTTTTTVPVAADTPAGLAEQIERSETAIRSGDPSFGHLQQVAYRALSAHPEWDAEVRS